MQDIDFDEIDRAVSSVNNTTPDASDTSSTSVPVSRPVSPASPSPAARRSSGRFMDVVHPSSDMRSSGVPERSVPREVPQKPTFEKPHEEKKEEAPKGSGENNWPDPLDFQGFKMDESPAPKPESNAPTEPEEKQDYSQPLESPFLAGAKVEKRPLGGVSVQESLEAELSSEEPSEPEEKPAEPEEERLLEAPEEEPLLEAENPEPESPVEEPGAVKPEEAETEPIEEPKPPVVAEEPTGPTSITQQYKEQPSTTEQVTGAIFDTEAYHQALTHTPKRKSGALVIVWIAALILVGAGAGAAVYFFVLPML